MANIAKKKKLKVKGDFTGTAAENQSGVSGSFLGKKKLKTKEGFDSSELGAPVGTFVAGDGKAAAWSYTLNNGLPAVQALAAGEAIHETYVVKFKAKGSKATTKDVVVTITGTNDAPTLTKNGGGAVTAAVQEGHSGAITTLTASDIDHAAKLTYSIDGGVDAARFNIDASTGALSFKAAPNFEAPTDAGTNNSYAVVVRVSDGSLSDTQAVTVNVTNVNEAPVITSDGGGTAATVNVAENTTAVTMVTSIDPEGTARTYSINGGADAAKFQINSSTGALSFISAPDFESPTDAGANNSYVVVVRASDGSLTDSQTITVNVTNVHEGLNTAPVITSQDGEDTAFITLQENVTIVTTVQAFDNEGDDITYSISGGLDADDFTIDPDTGVLSFIAAPDFENPTSSDGANLYFVEVTASDGSLSDSQDIAVTINDVNESGRTVIDLATLAASAGFVIDGDQSGNYAGSSVGVGDINGDGFFDVLIGARGADHTGGADAGAAYVIFGKSGAFGTISGGRAIVDVANDGVGDGFGSADGFLIQGDALGDNLGNSVTSAGDVNGDGFEDVVVGAYRGDDHINAAGETYVVFGKASGFGSLDSLGRSVVDLSNDSAGDGFAAADGFVIQGNTDNEQSGFSVSSAGDVNGDGFDDIIIGARYGDDGGLNSGTSYIIFGSASGFGTTDGAGRAVIDLATLSPSAGFVVAGDEGGDSAGRSVSGAGDLNRDGFDDLIVGAQSGDDGGSAAGEAYIIYGKAGTFGSLDGAGRRVVDLSNDTAGDGFAAADGFIIQGDANTDSTGRSVSQAGDVNGDGFADVIVGARGGDEVALANNGEAYIVFGTASGFGTTDAFGRNVLDLTTFTPSQGFIVRGEAVSDFAGDSVSSAGDFNGDGYADLLVVAPGGGASNLGEVYVVFGKSSGFGTLGVDGRAVIDIETLSPSEGIVLSNSGSGVNLNAEGGGDVNGDGFDDVVVGDPLDNTSYVVFGGAFGASTTPVNQNGGSGNEILIGALGNDSLSGGGGLDVFHAGKGNDTITAPNLGFRFVDGGNGIDKLVLTGSGATFDFTMLGNTNVQGIETLDFTGTGNNTLELSLSDALHLSNTPHAGFTGSVSAPKSLVIDGNAGDTLQLVSDARGTWTKQADDLNLNGTAGGAYDVWSLQSGSRHFVKLAVDADIGITILA